MINTENNLLVNPKDYNSLIELMDNHEQYPNIVFGENEIGETTWIAIFFNYIEITTFQHNNWTRHNIYHRDGTREEFYMK